MANSVHSSDNGRISDINTSKRPMLTTNKGRKPAENGPREGKKRFARSIKPGVMPYKSGCYCIYRHLKGLAAVLQSIEILSSPLDDASSVKGV